ncbi:cytidine deaminase [Halobacillus litoralis]|uniref:cytidine deaminase n=1 Tax=Halobacillus litoralis TaxID=45668 RepID=UPI001CD19EEA|nr:cytidine deaminase [Halobacillus litoralis]MCA0972073.1 cytidine deaminase [Halobacillus litoralis]
MGVEQKLFEEAKQLLEQRYPEGWGGAAAMYTDDGRVLTSVAPEVVNASTELCIETGAILEAHKWNAAVTHSICVVRENESEDVRILTPCGVCQERLMYWGREVKAAVSNRGNELLYKTLDELQPHHWSHAYSDEEFFE